MISIILPTYNGATRITQAIQSVQDQTYTDWQLLIIDDGSTEDTRAVLPADSRIRYIRNETNLGIQKTLNRGLQEATGTYIARIDDDDIWSDRDKLALQVDFLETHPNHVLVGTGAILVDEMGNELSRYLLPESDTDIRSKILRKNCFVHSSVLFRNTGARYSENQNVRHVEDYELWVRLGKEGKFANLPVYGVTLSVRTNSLTAKNRITQASRAIGLVWRFKRTYPGFILGLAFSCARYLFFSIQSIIPILPRLLYRIQSKQKGM
jgi:glycosyltransferase involved in cell wall biosynthesis